jgi:hypothetical protein
MHACNIYRNKIVTQPNPQPNMLLQHFILKIIRFFQLFLSMFVATSVKPLKKTPTHEDTFAKIIEFYKTMPDTMANANIQEELYINDKRKTLLEDANNPTEKLWSSRILIVHTQTGGNIMMYYNCFKMAFAYYSDSQMLSNKDLYYAAMKYVVQFRCRDFLIDMEHYPDNKMIELLRQEDKQMQTKKKSVPTSQKIKPTKQPKQVEPAYQFTTKFVRIGKMCEFNITQKPRDKKIELVNKLMFSDKPLPTMDNFFDNLDITETDSLFVTDEKPNSYAAWKKQQKQQNV